MRAATYLSPSIRAFGSFSSGDWKTPIQAAFAFFDPVQIRVHAVPNELADRLNTPVESAAPNVSCLSKHRQLVDASVTGRKSFTQPTMATADISGVNSLKILREFEPGKSRSSTGRLVISGSIADVCAALDRMAS